MSDNSPNSFPSDDSSDTTCWVMIDAAGRGDEVERERFARQYLEPVRAYLGARWRDSDHRDLLDDAVQEVFVECFRPGGPLTRADSRQGGFRPFLYGVVRNVARRMESGKAAERRKKVGSTMDLDAVVSDDTHLSQLFDRAWAESIMQQAAQRQRQLAADSGDAALRRFELLKMRFEEGLPIREIAKRWGVEAAWVHREYAKARDEFKLALREVVAFNQPGSAREVEQESIELLDLLN